MSQSTGILICHPLNSIGHLIGPPNASRHTGQEAGIAAWLHRSPHLPSEWPCASCKFTHVHASSAFAKRTIEVRRMVRAAVMGSGRGRRHVPNRHWHLARADTAIYTSKRNQTSRGVQPDGFDINADSSPGHMVSHRRYSPALAYTCQCWAQTPRAQSRGGGERHAVTEG